ncbi:hypothetical protein M8818_000338 [Zalaria obscura]|uniref:Uncharacterized protein n=1 Tax=Zalaria obscura TaxID=2024903 RepID=A0ACC3SMK7_9PEZI
MCHSQWKLSRAREDGSAFEMNFTSNWTVQRSWAPDWRKCHPEPAYILHFTSGHRRTNASGTSKAVVEYREADTVLVVSGIKISTVSHCTKSIPIDKPPELADFQIPCPSRRGTPRGFQ